MLFVQDENLEKCGGSRSLPLHYGDDAKGQAKSFRAWERKVLKTLGVEEEEEDGRGEEKAKWVTFGFSVPDKQSKKEGSCCFCCCFYPFCCCRCSCVDTVIAAAFFFCSCCCCTIVSTPTTGIVVAAVATAAVLLFLFLLLLLLASNFFKPFPLFFVSDYQTVHRREVCETVLISKRSISPRALLLTLDASPVSGEDPVQAGDHIVIYPRNSIESVRRVEEGLVSFPGEGEVGCVARGSGM